MRRFILILLIVVFVLGLSGCKKQNEELLEPVSFYYCNDDPTKEDFNHIFVPEIREGAGYDDRYESLLNLYLDGPISTNLDSPFPDGLYVLSFQQDGSQATIILNNQIAELSGLNLSTACTCLCLTIMDLVSCDSVCISAQSALLDGQESITLTSDTIVLADNYQAPIG